MMPKKTKPMTNKRPREVLLRVKLTPEGVQTAEARLAVLKDRIRLAAAADLRLLLQQRGNANLEFSDEEVMADLEEARDEVWRERQAKTG